jgi:hypothetical protein
VKDSEENDHEADDVQSKYINQVARLLVSATCSTVDYMGRKFK